MSRGKKTMKTISKLLTRKRINSTKKMLANIGLIEIVGSCAHTKKQHRHHPDYSKPFDIFLMCPSCHLKEHYIIRTCERLETYDMIPNEEIGCYLRKKLGFGENWELV